MDPATSCFAPRTARFESGEVHAGSAVAGGEPRAHARGGDRSGARRAPPRRARSRRCAPSKPRTERSASSSATAAGRARAPQLRCAGPPARGSSASPRTGDVVWSARFDDYEPVGGRVRSRTRSGSRPTQPATRAELVLSGVELNPALPADIFRLRPAVAGGPPGWRGGVAWPGSRPRRCVCSGSPPAPTIRIPTPTTRREGPLPAALASRRRRSTRQVSYTRRRAPDHGHVYDTLLEYHYLTRPYRLIPGLAREVPQRAHAAGRSRRLPLPACARALLFQDDPVLRARAEPAPRRARSWRRTSPSS